MKKTTYLIFLLMLFPSFAAAEVDLRIKGGITHLSTSEIGSNVQLEFDIIPMGQSTVSPLIAAGYFDRTHSKKIATLPVPGSKDNSSTIDYDASGLLGAVGIRVKTGEHGQLESKVEFSQGKGKPNISTIPGSINQPQEDSYTATAFILGYYYTFSRPGVQLGIEVGTQSFDGKYKVNMFGQSGKISGSAGIANITLGFRF
ncbi:MAG TPA: hypothetical protein VL197_00810 [Nitrospirota bacterium]|nr:hypothetical protein [Nitrospirota bacterium]